MAATNAANRSFSTVSTREVISFDFRFLRPHTNEDATLNALHSDLVIVGSPGLGGLPREWSAETLLLATGVPFLLLPEHWTGPVAEHVIVAWNASREARRAIADALPLLVGALSVTILVVDPQKNSRHGEEPGADVASIYHVMERRCLSNGSRPMESRWLTSSLVLPRRPDHGRLRSGQALNLTVAMPSDANGPTRAVASCYARNESALIYEKVLIDLGAYIRHAKEQ